MEIDNCLKKYKDTGEFEYLENAIDIITQFIHEGKDIANHKFKHYALDVALQIRNYQIDIQYKTHNDIATDRDVYLTMKALEFARLGAEPKDTILIDFIYDAACYEKDSNRRKSLEKELELLRKQRK